MTHPAIPDDPLVTCLRAYDVQSLPHVRAVLEAAGIPHVVEGEGVQTLSGVGLLGTGYNLALGPPVVRVPRSRLAEAVAALAEFDAAELPDDEE